MTGADANLACVIPAANVRSKWICPADDCIPALITNQFM
jgi:hypothetical protein